MAYGEQALARDRATHDSGSTAVDSPPGRLLPFSYETKRSIRILSLALVIWAFFLFDLAEAKNPPPPHPHKYGKAVKKMYWCNKRPFRVWTEKEIKCVIWRQFRRAGQYQNAVRIARCETGDTWNRFLVSHTDDHGIFQINRRWNTEGWRKGADIYDPVWNTRIAFWFWRTRGWGDWVCARLTGVS